MNVSELEFARMLVFLDLAQRYTAGDIGTIPHVGLLARPVRVALERARLQPQLRPALPWRCR